MNLVKLTMYKIPDLTFCTDESTDHGNKIDEMLRNLEQDTKKKIPVSYGGTYVIIE